MRTSLLTALAPAALSTTALHADDQTMETKVFSGSIRVLDTDRPTCVRVVFACR